MAATSLLETLHLAGLTVEALADGGLKVTPAASLTPELRQLIRDGKAALIESLKANMLPWPAFADPAVANDPTAPDREAWPERAAIAEYDGGLSRQDAEALADSCCWPHSSAMNGAEIDTFTARLARFTDKGLSLEDAERLADKLVIRDREGDDRRVCLECVHLRHGGRCGNWQAAGVAIRARDAQVPGDFTAMLQRCDGFSGAAI